MRISHWRCSVKQGVFLKRRTGVSEQAFIDPLQNRCSWIKFTGKNLCWSLFFIKLQLWEPATLLKKAPTQVFSCEICKLFKNNYFEEHLWTSASKLYLKRDSNTVVFLWIQEHIFCGGSMDGCFWNTSAEPYSLKAFNSIRETLAQVFLCEFCEILRKAFLQKNSKQPCLTWCCFFSFLQIREVSSLKSIYLLEQW